MKFVFFSINSDQTYTHKDMDWSAARGFNGSQRFIDVEPTATGLKSEAKET